MWTNLLIQIMPPHTRTFSRMLLNAHKSRNELTAAEDIYKFLFLSLISHLWIIKNKNLKTSTHETHIVERSGMAKIDARKFFRFVHYPICEYMNESGWMAEYLSMHEKGCRDNGLCLTSYPMGMVEG